MTLRSELQHVEAGSALQLLAVMLPREVSIRTPLAKFPLALRFLGEMLRSGAHLEGQVSQRRLVRHRHVLQQNYTMEIRLATRVFALYSPLRILCNR
jgi:hypothetical protein